MADVLPAGIAFSLEHERRFAVDGFVAVEGLLDEADVEEVLAALAQVLEHPGRALVDYESWAVDRLSGLSGAARMDAVRKFMHFVTESARLEALARDPRILTVVRQLCGSDDVSLLQDMALLKPPGGGREKPWHQDNAFFAFEPGTPIVGVWIALDAATMANGCMHVVPGSHRRGPVVHFRRRDFQICDGDVDADGDTVVPLQPGGALFFHGLLHHGTPANRTEKRRRAIQLHYVPQGVPGVSDQRRLDIFGDEGKDVTC
ncbi:phytanoyl-CoA dioxygenase family protein [Pseudactinotalea terrae]|uniref:phytanoyl-CoA dioxygenase family protein n=1 Tax=Pseudactinotalea terrae TaxID=1743262 RepID=UPI001390E1F2|nr:phytanoyl-CoA dioxygenase family protein [Pseudactinotalea terrae]